MIVELKNKMQVILSLEAHMTMTSSDSVDRDSQLVSSSISFHQLMMIFYGSFDTSH
jgi:hypothetical protein